MSFLRKFGTLLVDGAAGSATISLSLRAAGLGTFATSAEWVPAAGDVQISKDGGALGNVTNLPTYAAGQWKFILTAAELTARSVFVLIADVALDSESFVVETFGDSAAAYPGNFVHATLDSKGAETIAAYVDTEVAAIKLKTDLIPATPVTVADIPTAIQNAAALLATALPGSPTTDTVGEALVGMRAQAFGKWVVAGDTLTLYASNGTTALKTFTLAPSGEAYTSRTPS